MFAMKRPPAADEPDNTAVLNVCEKLNLPVRPASLQLAEANLRTLRKEREEVIAECNRCLQADWARDTHRSSSETKQAQAKVDEVELRSKAARKLVEDERKKWQPKFREELSVPIAAAADLIELELARLDLLTKALLNVHTFAVYCGIDTPIGRAPALMGAVQALRIAINQQGY